MTEVNDQLICDVCGRLAEARTEDAQGFEVTDWQDGIAVHLCPRCISVRDAGGLALSPMECVRCHRDERSGEDEWHQIEDPAGRKATYCGDCWAELDLGQSMEDA